jgi:hypothetical protein
MIIHIIRGKDLFPNGQIKEFRKNHVQPKCIFNKQPPVPTPLHDDTSDLSLPMAEIATELA